MKFTRLTGKLLFERRFKKSISKISGSLDLQILQMMLLL
jgi:hypothetical protein